MNTRKVYAYGELDDGTTWDGIRVLLSTRIAFEKSAAANNWDVTRNFATSGAFLSWHAARAAHRHTLTWEEFLAKALDADVTTDAPTSDDPDPEGPTQTAPSTG